jgi:hypothetical protein
MYSLAHCRSYYRIVCYDVWYHSLIFFSDLSTVCHGRSIWLESSRWICLRRGGLLIHFKWKEGATCRASNSGNGHYQALRSGA